MRTEMKKAPTSWISVICGWIAAVGAAALAAPAVATALATRPASPGDLVLAVPVIVGLAVAYLIGGYVAGRMAGYRTSWHGMMAAFFGLLITLLALLLGATIEGAPLRQLDVRSLGDVVTFGAIFSFLVTIFAGWVGGLLAPDQLLAERLAAPSRVVERETVPVVEERVVHHEKPRFRLLPELGRKGGERVAERGQTEPAESVEGR